MKRILLASLTAAMAFSASAQVNDSVLTGAGYANQVWYSLQNDEQGTAAKNNWDLAFNLKDVNAPIHINTVTGTTLWNYPNADTSGWSTVDTTGINTWSKRYNSDTSWALGAMGNYADPANPFDLDWGIYDMTTHFVTGDSLYIIRLASGDYKKLWIKSLISGVFTFRYADLNGSNEQTKTIAKTDYAGRNFAYFSIQNNAPLNREPDATNWDLLFTQYTDMTLVYTVTGVLHNRGVRVAQAGNLANKLTYNNWQAHAYSSAINEIGYDWKRFTGTTYKIQDSLAYFVRVAGGDIWKMIFTGFASADGKFVFSKQKLATTSVGTVPGAADASFAVYPNPAAGNAVTVVYDFEQAVSARLTVTDMAGRVVHTAPLQQQAGLHQYQLPVTGWTTGVYLVGVDTGKDRMVQKLIIR